MIYQRMANPRAHDVASQTTDSIRCPRAEGPSIYWITQGLYLTYNCFPQYIIWGYFTEMCNKSHWILQRIYRSKVCNRRAFALSRCCWVSRSRPRESGETVTVISLWRHNSGPWDNGESIATPQPEQWAVLPYKEIRAYGYHIRKTREYGYHIRKTKWYGYADHVGCIRVNFGQSTG